MKRVTLNNDYDKMLISGKSYLFKDYDAAMGQSKKVTTHPKIITIQADNYHTQYYLACGGCWIRDNGDRGQYTYGRRGQLIDVQYTDF